MIYNCYSKDNTEFKPIKPEDDATKSKDEDLRQRIEEEGSLTQIFT